MKQYTLFIFLFTCFMLTFCGSLKVYLHYVQFTKVSLQQCRFWYYFTTILYTIKYFIVLQFSWSLRISGLLYCLCRQCLSNGWLWTTFRPITGWLMHPMLVLLSKCIKTSEYVRHQETYKLVVVFHLWTVWQYTLHNYAIIKSIPRKSSLFMRHLGTLQNTSEMTVQQRTTDTRMNLVIELDIMYQMSAHLQCYVCLCYVRFFLWQVWPALKILNCEGICSCIVWTQECFSKGT